VQQPEGWVASGGGRSVSVWGVERMWVSRPRGWLGRRLESYSKTRQNLLSLHCHFGAKTLSSAQEQNQGGRRSGFFSPRHAQCQNATTQISGEKSLAILKYICKSKAKIARTTACVCAASPCTLEHLELDCPRLHLIRACLQNTDPAHK
jgi:hypothetical protein